jgi:caa(3)-type oxidase subunit IV
MMSSKAAPQTIGTKSGHDTSAMVQLYLRVFAALGALTLLTVGVAYLHLPHSAAILIALLIAVTKITLIAMFFMHLKGESPIINWSLGICLVLLLVLLLFVLPDIGVGNPVGVG